MAKYLWYSGATDITGGKLAEALELTGTKRKPQRITRNDIIIGWGTKTNEDVNLGNAIVFNHPNAIRANRNKFKSLVTMSNNNDVAPAIAKFCTSDEVDEKLRQNEIKLPLVGRTNFHQGGKGFWLCLTKSHVNGAVRDGAQYFQEYIPIKNEYRLHIVFGKIIYAVKKVESPSIDHWKEQRKEKIQSYANKNNWDYNEDIVNRVLDILAKEITLPDRIVKSNRRGWKFSSVRLNILNANLKATAIKALEAVSLDFAAVDCALSENNDPYIIEINSGPGLEKTTFDKYVEAFNTKLATVNNRRNVVQRPVNQPARQNRNNQRGEQERIDPEALVHMMNAVRSPAEARRVLDLMQAAGNE